MLYHGNCFLSAKLRASTDGCFIVVFIDSLSNVKNFVLPKSSFYSAADGSLGFSFSCIATQFTSFTIPVNTLWIVVKPDNSTTMDTTIQVFIEFYYEIILKYKNIQSGLVTKHDCHTSKQHLKRILSTRGHSHCKDYSDLTKCKNITK